MDHPKDQPLCLVDWTSRVYMDVSENSGTPKSSIFIGFSIIFTIHSGVLYLFLETSYSNISHWLT